MYIHQLSGWPKFTWHEEQIAAKLALTRYKQGQLLGHLNSLGFSLQDEAALHALTEEIVKSNEIEGENFDKKEVRSSIARKLGIEAAGTVPSDEKVDGVVEMMVDATQNFQKPLTKERLFNWHANLFPIGHGGFHAVKAATWRDDSSGPMQVVSGPVGREKVHFEAPSAELIQAEIGSFLAWFESDKNLDPVITAAVAHIWFLTIHPFEDGNGRIARAITELALTRAEKKAHRFYSLSASLRKKRAEYYTILEHTQKGNLDITKWLIWFLNALEAALDNAQNSLDLVMAKARFWETHRTTPLNPRQNKVINRLLDGFEGNLSSSKWAKIAKTSQDTATRDLNDLIAKGILRRGNQGGRSTQYELIVEESDSDIELTADMKAVLDERLQEDESTYPTSLPSKLRQFRW